MRNSYYWFSKFDKLAGLSFKNALRLHFDSIRLFQAESFSSALALSVIAMEELAKAHLLEDMVWHAMIDKTPLDFSWKEIQNMLYSHRAKQRVFSSRIFMATLKTKKGKSARNPFYDFVQSGDLEELKQRALYVGLAPSGSSSQRLRIQNPLAIASSTSKKIITILNDYLLDITIGVIHEYYGFDAQSIEDQIDESLLNRLIQDWPSRGQIGKKATKIHLEIKTG